MNFSSSKKHRNSALIYSGSNETIEIQTISERESDLERKKSVEDLLTGTQEAIGNLSLTNINVLQTASPALSRKTPSPTGSPKNSKNSKPSNKTDLQSNINEKISDRNDIASEDFACKLSDSSLQTTSEVGKQIDCVDKPKPVSKLSERAKKKSWYSVLYPSYKSRSEDFKKLFKDVPDDERLVVDYSSALQREILVHGRLYASQNYLCFHANIFGWETCLSVKWKDVTSVTKEKTAKVIPNAILVCTAKDKHFFTSFTTRDKAFLMLFRVWQNALLDKQMNPQEMWQFVHNCYGDELGLTSDDEDYIDPSVVLEEEHSSQENFKAIDEDKCNETNTTSSSGRISDTNSGADYRKHFKDIIKMEEVPNNKPLDGKRKVSKNTRQRDEYSNKNSETLPTDMSDSSDSDQSKIPFVNTAECTSDHEGRQMMHTILPINIDTLFNLLFSKSKFLVDFHVARKSQDMMFGEWNTSDDGVKTRTVKLTVALAPAVGPKTAKVTEAQSLRECTKPGELYSIDIESTNAGIPYADSFMVLMHYCLVKTVDDHTMLSIHANIKYKKSIWGVVKGFIEKNTWNGLEEFYGALLRALQNETCIPPAKGKGRRPRRGTAATIRSPTEELIIQTAIVPDVIKKILPKPVEIFNKPTGNYKWISCFVIVLLCALIILNVILLFKLWNLEDRIESESASQQQTMPNLSTIKNLPKNHQDWVELLRQQEALHETEFKKWHTVLQTAIELLKKVSVVCQTIINGNQTNSVDNFKEEL